ncbi:GAF domain-containing protein [Geobacter chapellei]|uniref:histidine kinase n=2 Tax=Pelotalea chapellei TaxID=44671 RepID=A0ABS5UC45_9BACT|nr:histidine kinase dimerization/phospho-acceptor domain-containing protein [Pelotalea chapellei]MBT1073221.1 GAF domain-containing protein [Pelotalea chapellei]
MGDCPNIHAGDEDLLQSRNRRILEKCSECNRFKRDLSRFRDSGHPLAPVFSLVHSEYQRQKTQIESLVSFLDNKTLEVRFLHELGSVLQSSVDLEEVLSVALTAITAGKGFGMNRAFLLLINRDLGLLHGYLAIGPRNYEEANQVWNEIAGNDMDLQTLAQSFRLNKLNSERAKFHDILARLTVPLSETGHILVKALDGKHPVLIENAFNHPEVNPELAHLLGVDRFLLMPLISRNRRVGMIIADNCITHRSITQEDMRSLENFAFPVAFAIERASLYDRLQLELNRATEAGNKLKEQQEVIVKMEKMALVGRITSSIAHSIRNPLMIIGGFARSILKNTPTSDPKRDFIESIVGEARQLEGVLDEILNYTDMLYPTRDFWDVNQLVESSIRDTSDRLRAWGCESTFIPDTSLPPVFIDYKQVSYCLRTMIISDIDGHEGGKIDISTYLDGDNVIVHAVDTSVRLSQEALDAMLVPFSTTLELGNGLGLALCKTMLEKQGIPFNAQLLPEKGVEYIITLPTRKEEQS